jgi:hypothetical protein
MPDAGGATIASMAPFPKDDTKVHKMAPPAVKGFAGDNSHSLVAVHALNRGNCRQRRLRVQATCRALHASHTEPSGEQILDAIITKQATRV